MGAEIGKVSESLRNLLQAQMSPTTTVTLLSPFDTSSSTTRINLFLFRVTKNPHLNNQDWLLKPGTTDQLVRPPLVLNLYYLLTPFAPLDAQTGLADTHGIMGEAMRVLYENPIIPQASLANGLTQGQVKLILASADVEELSKIWTALTKDYRLSAVYEVSYVSILAKAELPMPRRVRQANVGVQQGSNFPVVGGMEPLSGKAGSSLQFRGSNLAGWRANVVIGGQSAVSNQQLDQSSNFSVTIPAGLGPGVYEVDVDVAHLSYFQSFLEVTP